MQQDKNKRQNAESDNLYVNVEWMLQFPFFCQSQMTIAEFNRFVVQEPTARMVAPDPVYADFERFHEWHQKMCPKLSIEEASKTWRV